jgi:hypothetical protein
MTLVLTAEARADVRVFFTKMSVNNCKEIGTCDWKLYCALGNQTEEEFFSMKEANTGENIAINRVLTQRDFPPVIVHCTVEEHDGGIGAEWEPVGSGQVVVRTTGSHTIRMSNNEGDVTVHFGVESIGSTGQPLEADPGYSGTLVPAGPPTHLPRFNWEFGIRGVLLVGKFRMQRELMSMSAEDRRNTLIVELAGRTRDPVGYYQSLNDRELAGAGALLVYLRGTGSRSDAELRTMSADDMRNTVIVEVGTQTGRGRELQGLSNIELMTLVLEEPTSYLR